MLGFHHSTDGATGQYFADLKWWYVGFTIDHAPPHVRVDGHAEIGDLNFSIVGFSQRRFNHLEVCRLGYALRTLLEND